MDGWEVEQNTQWVVVTEITGLQMVLVRIVQRKIFSFNEVVTDSTDTII